MMGELGFMAFRLFHPELQAEFVARNYWNHMSEVCKDRWRETERQIRIDERRIMQREIESLELSLN